MSCLIWLMMGCNVTTAGPTSPDAGPGNPLIGVWSDQRTWLHLGEDADFRWHEPEGCSVPPCPLKTMTGTWRHNQTHLELVATPEGREYVMRYRVQWNPRRLHLSSENGRVQWNLTHTRP